MRRDFAGFVHSEISDAVGGIRLETIREQARSHIGFLS